MGASKVIALKEIDYIVGDFFEEKRKFFNDTLNAKYESLEPNGLQTWIAKTMGSISSDKDNLIAKLEAASFEEEESNDHLVSLKDIKNVINDAFKDIIKDTHFPRDKFLYAFLQAMGTVSQYWQSLHPEQFFNASFKYAPNENVLPEGTVVKLNPGNATYINPLELR